MLLMYGLSDDDPTGVETCRSFKGFHDCAFADV